MVSNPKPGETVLLIGTDPPNSVLEGMAVTVSHRTRYGAVVATEVGSGQYRAHFHEMVRPHILNGKYDADNTHSEMARDMGYTGDVCAGCGSMRVRRSGSCLQCDECGQSGGCT